MRDINKMKKVDLINYAAQLEARLAAVSACGDKRTASPADAARVIRDRFDVAALEVELFWVILLNARQQTLHVEMAAKGHLAQVDIHPRTVFQPAIRMNCHSIVIAHNHPSGDPNPSDSDIVLTQRMVDAGELLGIPVLDSLILTHNRTLSFAGYGIMPSPRL